MKTLIKDGQTYWKIGTRMNPTNYATNEDGPEFDDWDKCKRACEAIKPASEGQFVPIRMVKPVPQPIRPEATNYSQGRALFPDQSQPVSNE